MFHSQSYDMININLLTKILIAMGGELHVAHVLFLQNWFYQYYYTQA